MKRIIFVFVVILLSIGAIAAQGKQAVISAKETTFDFGTIKEGDGKVSHTFVIDNTGDGPLVLTRVLLLFVAAQLLNGPKNLLRLENRAM